MQDFFTQFDEVRWFQVSQHKAAPESLDIAIVKEHPTDEAALATKIHQGLKQKLGRDASISFTRSIAEAKNGEIGFVKQLD